MSGKDDACLLDFNHDGPYEEYYWNTNISGAHRTHLVAMRGFLCQECARHVSAFRVNGKKETKNNESTTTK